MNKIRLDNKDFYYQVFYKNIKNMYLRVKDNNLLSVSCNKFVSKQRIEEFIIKNQERILSKIQDHIQKVSLYDEEHFLLFGRDFRIVSRFSMKKNTFEIIQDQILINFKSQTFDNTQIEKIYSAFILKEIKKILDSRSSDITPYLDYDRLIFKTQLMKSRFGSCIPSKKIIKLNTILGRFSVEYLEAILIHELIHLEVPNHQKEFYNLINIMVPNYKKIRKELQAITRKYVI